jgi:SpoIIAA-like
MLTIVEDELHGCLILKPSGPLTQRDLEVLNQRFEAWAGAMNRAPGLVIRADRFPAWTDIAALRDHFGFIRSHHRQVRRVAFVSDARALAIAPRLGGLLVGAKVRHFPANRMAAALEWVSDGPPPAREIADLPDFVVGAILAGASGLAAIGDLSLRVEAALARHGRARLLCCVVEGPAGSAQQPAGSGEVARLPAGIERVALVSDLTWVRDGVRLVAPLAAAEVRLFAEDAMDEARAWIAD